MANRPRPRPTALSRSSVLITESAEEFDRFHDDFSNELKPRGPVERPLVDGMAGNVWEIRRLNRAKTGVINANVRSGLERLLRSLMPQTESEMDLVQWLREIHRLAGQWFGDERDKKEFLEILEKFKLEESAIEAAAVESAAPHLERIDRLIASLKRQLREALYLLAELRGGLGRQLHAKVERIIDGKVLALKDASKKPPPAAA
jgi:hypothetical protein